MTNYDHSKLIEEIEKLTKERDELLKAKPVKIFTYAEDADWLDEEDVQAIDGIRERIKERG